MKTKEKEHLPIFGIGPLCVISSIGITAACIFLSKTNSKLIDNAIGINYELPSVFILTFMIIGFCLIAVGCALWISAVFVSKIDRNIVSNKLVTSGVYAIVRNPIYSAFLFVCTGSIFFVCDWKLLAIPILLYLYLTILMKYTEEKWLLKTFGAEYEAYCKHVNRCIPCLRKN